MNTKQESSKDFLSTIESNLHTIMQSENSFVSKAEQFMEIQSDINIYENRINRREKRIKTEKESLTDQTVTFSRLKNKHFARLASREEKLVQEIKSLESKSKQNEHKKILLSDQINEMQNDYEALINRKEELQSIMEQCQSLIDSYSNYSSKYDTQNVQREVNDLIKDINLVDKKINTLNIEINQMQIKNENIKNDIDKANDQIRYQKNRIDKFSKSNTESILSLKKEIEEANNRYKIVRKNEDELKQELITFKDFNHSLTLLNEAIWDVEQKCELQKKLYSYKQNERDSTKRYFLDQVSKIAPPSFPSISLIEQMKEVLARKLRFNSRLRRMEEQLKRIISCESNLKYELKYIEEKFERQGKLTMLLNKLELKLNDLNEDNKMLELKQKPLRNILNQISEEIFLAEKTEMYLNENNILPRFQCKPSKTIFDSYNFYITNSNDESFDCSEVENVEILSIEYEKVQNQIRKLKKEINKVSVTNAIIRRQMGELGNEWSKHDQFNNISLKQHKENVDILYTVKTSSLSDKNNDVLYLERLVTQKQDEIKMRKKQIQKARETYLSVIQEYGKSWKENSMKKDKEFRKDEIIFYSTKQK